MFCASLHDSSDIFSYFFCVRSYRSALPLLQKSHMSPHNVSHPEVLGFIQHKLDKARMARWLGQHQTNLTNTSSFQKFWFLGKDILPNTDKEAYCTTANARDEPPGQSPDYELLPFQKVEDKSKMWLENFWEYAFDFSFDVQLAQ